MAPRLPLEASKPSAATAVQLTLLSGAGGSTTSSIAMLAVFTANWCVFPSFHTNFRAPFSYGTLVGFSHFFKNIQHKRPRPKSMRTHHGEGRHHSAPRSENPESMGEPGELLRSH